MSDEVVEDATLLWRECEVEIGWAILEEAVGEAVAASFFPISGEVGSFESLDKESFSSSNFVSSSSLASGFLLPPNCRIEMRFFQKSFCDM